MMGPPRSPGVLRTPGLLPRSAWRHRSLSKECLNKRGGPCGPPRENNRDRYLLPASALATALARTAGGRIASTACLTARRITCDRERVVGLRRRDDVVALARVGGTTRRQLVDDGVRDTGLGDGLGRARRVVVVVLREARLHLRHDVTCV